MKIQKHDDDYNKEYFFTIVGIPPNHIMIADYLGINHLEYFRLIEKYGVKKIESNKGELWTTKIERDNFLDSPEFKFYLENKEKEEFTKIEFVINKMHQEILEKGWSNVRYTYHPDVNIDYQEAFHIFALYKQVYESRVKNSDYKVFTSKDKRLLLNLHKIFSQGQENMSS